MKVTIVTQAYNAESYIAQCIESVLHQTYTDFQYIAIDNGSVDKTGEIIQQYAENDDRIKFIQYEQNGRGRWYDAICGENDVGEYIAALDADDWLEPDFLERLLNLAESTNADMVITGSVMHFEKTGQESARQLPQRLILNKQNFANVYPLYHAFLRPIWGKIVRRSVIGSSPEFNTTELGVVYGADTLYSFAWLRQCSRICLDNSALHHYRIHSKSISHKYDPRQSYSDIYLFNDALDFLKPYGPVSAENMKFIYRVYANAIVDTVTNIKNSHLSPEERLAEYQKILARPETRNAFKVRSDDTDNCRVFLVSAVLEAGAALPSEHSGLYGALSQCFPNCANAVTPDFAKLFLIEKPLFEALLYDNKNALAENLISMIEKQKYTKQFDLGKLLCALAKDKPLLDRIADTKFIRRSSEIYRLVWRKQYSEALDLMTDKLLKENVDHEEFFELYLSLAALLECVDEFIFGKIKLARFCVDKMRFDECRALLEELSEMGVEDNDDIVEIKQKLNA